MTNQWEEEFDKEFPLERLTTSWMDARPIPRVVSASVESLKSFIRSHRTQLIESIINDLESNPDTSVENPNLQLWIELKQAQLKAKYLELNK